MRSKCGVYVDAGYLLSAAATRVTGTSLRNGISADYPGFLESLILESETLTELPVLRVNWYDAAQDGIPDQTQERIGVLPRVKLRLGRFGFDGQQKGVDLRIGLDMVAHARNGAVETIVLVSGDDDLTEAVEEVQVQGVQVILLAVPALDGRPHGVSKHLHRAADNLEVMQSTMLDEFIHRRRTSAVTVLPTPTTGSMSTPATTTSRAPSPAVLAGTTRTLPTSAVTTPNHPTAAMVLSEASEVLPVIAAEYVSADEEVVRSIDGIARKVVAAFRTSVSTEELVALEAGRPSIPRDVDRALLRDLSEALDTDNLDEEVRTQLRKRFWEMVDGE